MRTRVDSIAEVGLCLLIVGVVLAFGGVQPLAYSIMQAVVFALFLLILIQQTHQGKISLPLPIWPCLFALLVVLQLVPMPLDLLTRLSPARAVEAALQGLGVPFGEEGWRPLSIYPRETLFSLTRFLAYLAAFVIAARVFDSGRRRSSLVFTLVALGCFEAAYGSFQYLTGWQKIFTYEKQFYTQEATGTYINRNHFAGLLELTLPFVAASAFYSYQIWAEERTRRSGRTAQQGPATPGFRALFYLFLAVVMAVALIFSRSRMGIMAMLFALICVALLAQVRLRQTLWVVVVALFLIVVGSYGLWIGLDPVLARFERMADPTYLGMEGRLSMWRDGLHLIRAYPLTGTGLGTFDIGFRRFQTGLVDKYVDHAHNDYIEFAAETGLPGAALLFLPVFYLLARMVKSFLDDPRRYRRSVTLGCIGSTVALLLHSLTDFNLQMPANALIFAIVLGIAYKATCIERRAEGPVDLPRAEISPGNQLLRG